MHRINDIVVKDGTLVLSNLPFADGEHVRVDVSGIQEPASPRNSIEHIRQMLKGRVEKFDQPFEPMIPLQEWEMTL